MIAFAENRAPDIDYRVATHDGYIWPDPRFAMKCEAAIVARMAEDIRRLEIAPQALLDIHVAAKGWSLKQIGLYGRKAAELAMFGEIGR